MRTFIAVAFGALVLVTGAFATAAPALRLQSLNPFVVRGTNFHAREHVHVTLVAPGMTSKRRVRATSSGTFRVDFGEVALGRCGGYTVRAIGGGGAVATLKRTPLPACMP